MDHLRLDLAFAVRAFARRPGFTLLVIITFGLGIGATTAMFSVVDAVLLRPLPYPNAEQIVAIYPTLPEWRNTGLHAHWERASFSNPELLDFQRLQTSFESVAGYSGTRATLLVGGAPERIQIGIGSPDLFPLLGARPHLGRLFAADDLSSTIVLTHGLWQRRFGGDSEVLGRTIQLNGQAHQVVGVLPAGFEVAGFAADLWRPI
ncbi:MAG: ABC transporter permease, partial [Gemmatimonadota bacterium]